MPGRPAWIPEDRTLAAGSVGYWCGVLVPVLGGSLWGVATTDAGTGAFGGYVLATFLLAGVAAGAAAGAVVGRDWRRIVAHAGLVAGFWDAVNAFLVATVSNTALTIGDGTTSPVDALTSGVIAAGLGFPKGVVLGVVGGSVGALGWPVLRRRWPVARWTTG